MANKQGFPFALDKNPITCGTVTTSNDNPLTGYRHIAFAGETLTETTPETIMSGPCNSEAEARQDLLLKMLAPLIVNLKWKSEYTMDRDQVMELTSFSVTGELSE